MMIVVAMNGTFILEQPFGSLFEFYPRWRDFINALIRTGGENAVSQLNCYICFCHGLTYPFMFWLVPSCNHSTCQDIDLFGHFLGHATALDWRNVNVNTLYSQVACIYRWSYHRAGKYPWGSYLLCFFLQQSTKRYLPKSDQVSTISDPLVMSCCSSCFSFAFRFIERLGICFIMVALHQKGILHGQTLITYATQTWGDFLAGQSVNEKCEHEVKFQRNQFKNILTSMESEDIKDLEL